MFENFKKIVRKWKLKAENYAAFSLKDLIFDLLITKG
jgi:hypothetical protein